MTGPCSEFGGPNDKGMKDDDGLSLYEHWEADLRPDIFTPHDDWKFTWQRLRPDFPYIALRFDHAISRERLQWMPHKITNPRGGRFMVGFLVDYGPSPDTGRVADFSPIIMKTLNLKTDDVVVVNPML